MTSCCFINCNARRSYKKQYQGAWKYYCTRHKDEKSIPVDKKCKCGKQPSFGFEGKKAICCKNCKEYDMVNVRHKKCVCGKRSSFGIEGGHPTCCKDCKLQGMVTNNKKCKCGKRASFGFEGEQPICCNDCKLPGMVTNNKKCKCGKRPSFGFEGERAICCNVCKLEGMVTINRKCPCGKQPSFGFDGDRVICCNDCKLEGMIDMIHKKCPCWIIACFGFEGEKPICCRGCKEVGMINKKRCMSNSLGIDCPIIGNKKYDGYCTHCFANLFPGDPRTERIHKKSKEIRVKNFVEKHFANFIADKPLYVDLRGGCCESKRRIDLRKLIDNTMLCIEVDEDQHKWYCKKDEIMRYNDLFMDFSGRYIFIRFNPDGYILNGERRNPRLPGRLENLKSEIIGHIERIEKGENTDLVEIHHLYYDS